MRLAISRRCSLQWGGLWGLVVLVLLPHTAGVPDGEEAEAFRVAGAVAVGFVGVGEVETLHDCRSGAGAIVADEDDFCHSDSGEVEGGGIRR